MSSFFFGFYNVDQVQLILGGLNGIGIIVIVGYVCLWIGYVNCIFYMGGVNGFYICLVKFDVDVNNQDVFYNYGGVSGVGFILIFIFVVFIVGV